MKQQSKEWTIVWRGMIAAILAAVLYSLTRSNHYSADSLIYALVIENPTWELMVERSHLLLHPVGLVWYRLWQVLGWSGQAIIPLQNLNALFGGLAVGLMWMLSYRISQNKWIASLIGLGFMVSGGMWLLSVEAEFVTISLAMQLLVIGLVLGVRQTVLGRSWYAVLLGTAVFVAILSYLTNVIFILVVIAGFSTAELNAGTKRRQLLIFLATIMIHTSAILIFYNIISSGQGIPLRQGDYGQLSIFDFPHGVYAFLRSFGLYPGLAMNDSTELLLASASSQEKIIFFSYYGFLALLVIGPIMCLLWKRKAVWQRYKRVILVLLTWLLPLVLFAFYWVPGDVTFWVPVLAGWWLFTAICLSTSHRFAWTLTLMVTILLLGYINASQVILPRTNLASNEAYQAAMRIQAETDESDLLVGLGNDYLALSINYFAGKKIIPHDMQSQSLEDLPEWVLEEAEKAREMGGRLLLVARDGTLVQLK